MLRPLMLLAALVLTSTVSAQTTWYVDQSNPNCPGDGSQANPFCKIQDAINSAAPSGDTVRIAPGRYVENLTIDKDLNLIGTAGPTVTIVDGNQAGSVLIIPSAKTIDLYGLTLTNGFATVGGGIAVTGGTLNLTNSTVCGNWSIPGSGGGIFSDGATLSLINSTVSANRSHMNGAGIYGFHCAVNIHNSLAAGNDAYHSSHEGGAIFLDYAPLTMTNSIVANNHTGGMVGGIAGYPGIQNWSTCLIKNSIIWGNVGRLGIQIGSMRAIFGRPYWEHPRTRYSDCEFSVPGAGNISVDPLFVDPLNGDYRLTSTSPCIDTGDPTSAPTGLDLYGNPRFLDGDLDGAMRVDMGAHEFSNVQLAVTGNATPGGTISFDTTGKARLPYALILGTAPGETLVSPYGAFFMDLTAPLAIPHFGTIQQQVPLTLPSVMPTPVTVYCQDLAIDLAAGAGNTSNPVELVIR